MSADTDRIDSYAALVVHVGANVQPGQEVLVSADVSHAPIARAVAEQAYAVGAARVLVEYHDPYVRRSALRHAPEAARRAQYRYACFEHFGEDPQTYGYATAFNLAPSCEAEAASINSPL